MALVATSGNFPAKFEDVCVTCKEDILKGQFIHYTMKGVEHEGCEDSNDERVETVGDLDRAGLPQPLQRPVCGTCFLELPTSLVCGNC
jgi:hypothetical protein